MRKAQNFLEISLLCCLVAVVAATVVVMCNRQNANLVGMSKVALASQKGGQPPVNVAPVNLNTATAAQLASKTPYNKVETAGTSALNHLNLSQAAFESAFSNIPYSALAGINADGSPMAGGSILNEAGTLNTELQLNYSDSLVPTNITTNTLSGLLAIYNTIIAPGFKAATQAAQDAIPAFISKFESIVKAAES